MEYVPFVSATPSQIYFFENTPQLNSTFRYNKDSTDICICTKTYASVAFGSRSGTVFVDGHSLCSLFFFFEQEKSRTFSLLAYLPSRFKIHDVYKWPYMRTDVFFKWVCGAQLCITCFDIATSPQELQKHKWQILAVYIFGQLFADHLFLSIQTTLIVEIVFQLIYF